MKQAALKALMNNDLENFFVASTPGGIESQEKRGQMQQATAETLPRDGTLDRRQWEALGFKFLSNADDLFVNAQFPKGWKKQPTDHSMWSDILDDKGRKRGSIFYKAAFYDRSAHCSLERRYSISTYETGATEKERLAVIKDCGKVVETVGSYQSGDYNKSDALQDRCKAWLKKHKPDWENPSAYWD